MEISRKNVQKLDQYLIDKILGYYWRNKYSNAMKHLNRTVINKQMYFKNGKENKAHKYVNMVKYYIQNINSNMVFSSKNRYKDLHFAYIECNDDANNKLENFKYDMKLCKCGACSPIAQWEMRAFCERCGYMYDVAYECNNEQICKISFIHAMLGVKITIYRNNEDVYYSEDDREEEYDMFGEPGDIF